METKQIKTGRRKTSVAQAELVKGSGKITINTKSLEDYFRGCPRYQDTVVAPLSELKAEKDFDVNVKVCGGGIASQAGAIRHAIARSLAVLGEAKERNPASPKREDASNSPNVNLEVDNIYPRYPGGFLLSVFLLIF